MAEFAPNLDDGELWLPADIIDDVGLRRYHQSSSAAARVRHRHASDVEHLANQLAAFGWLDLPHLHPALKQRPALSVPLEGFKPPGTGRQVEPADRELLTGLLHQGREAAAPDVYGRRFQVSLRPEAVRRWPVDPVQLQVEAFGRVSQRPLRPIQNSFGSVRPSAPRRERGGTGVFHPRVVAKHETNKRYAAGEHQKQQQLTRSAALRQQQQGRSPFQQPSEMGLPQDWTY
ncbi:hypothetical protein Cni_G12788 [Canna indica]|uniref:Uncharacterized protein n=1 Tax=Canna indica TaxID=4628 RepID=A0AAQ3KCR3_9LILI|nr:hypothetical protein Cni_G12788 [Canna indica]